MTYNPPLSQGNYNGLTPLAVRKILELEEENVRREDRELRNEEPHDLNILPNNNRTSSRPRHACAGTGGPEGMDPIYSQRRRNIGMGAQHHAPDALSWKTLVTHCTGGWVGIGAGPDGHKILGRTGIQTPDNPAHSESSYRLSYRRRIPETHKMIKSKGMRSVGIVVLVRKPRRK